MASQITKRIKIGTKVTARLFGGRMVTGVVDSIEKCKIGEKYGTPVSSAPFGAGNYTFGLDCGNWCYGDQIRTIVN
jgi:hypothetical protein